MNNGFVSAGRAEDSQKCECLTACVCVCVSTSVSVCEPLVGSINISSLAISLSHPKFLLTFP